MLNSHQKLNLTPPGTLSKILIGCLWLIYVVYLLLSDLPPGPSLLHPAPEIWEEALNLSLNFWLILPLLFPHTAPVLSPTLEALFNIVVAWALLFWGFILDGRDQKIPMIPFLIGTAFLTNVFYLPWLALRHPNPQPPKLPLTALEKVGESRTLPLFMLTVVIASVFWGIFGRPEFGGLPQRWESLTLAIATDRLAYSFLLDLILFSLLQSWLVQDDMIRRQSENPRMLWLVRLLPFFGLVIYLLRRPKIPTEKEQE